MQCLQKWVLQWPLRSVDDVVLCADVHWEIIGVMVVEELRSRNSAYWGRGWRGVTIVPRWMAQEEWGEY